MDKKPNEVNVSRAAFDISRTRVRYYKECKQLIEEKTKESISAVMSPIEVKSVEMREEEAEFRERPRTSALVEPNESIRDPSMTYEGMKKDIQSLMKIHRLIKSPPIS